MVNKGQLRKDWYLGFFGFFGIFGLSALLRGDWFGALWLVWIFWFLYFIPVKEKQGVK